MLKASADDRTIVWLFDPFGKTGKSQMVKYYGVKGLAHVLGWEAICCRPQEPANLLYSLYSRGCEVDKSVVFFDFTRAVPVYIDVSATFGAMESIKNACTIIINIVPCFLQC